MSPRLHLEFRILRCGFWIPDTGFQSLSVDLGTLDSNLKWDSGFRIPNSRISYYTRQSFSEFGFHEKKNSWRSSCVAKQSRTCSWPPDRAEWNNKTTGLNGKGRFRTLLRGPDKFLKGQNLAWIWPYQKYKCRSKFLTGTVRFLRRLV